MAKKKNSSLSSALLYIVIGVLLFLFPGDALKWAMTIGGAFFENKFGAGKSFAEQIDIVVDYMNR